MDQENQGFKTSPFDEKEDVVMEMETDMAQQVEKVEEWPADENLSEVEQLKQQVEHYRELAAQNEEKAMRALADLENYRRRARKEKEEVVRYAAVPIVESLLPVLDNFERALEAAEQNNDMQILIKGIEMVYRQLLTALSDAGLSLVEAKGKEFDPHEHIAVAQVEHDEFESGMVVEELQSGYRFQDRVIRPSMVKVCM